MTAAPRTGTESVLPTSYARLARPRASALRRWWRPAAGLVAVLGLASVLLAWRLGLYPGAGAGLSGATVFTVQPTDLLVTLKEDGELKPRESIELRNEVEGTSTILFIVPESTRVQKGDLLVELASDQLKERYDTEMLALRTTQAACEAAVQDLAITENENASRQKKAEIDRDVAELELRQYLEGEFQQKLKDAEIAIKQTKQEILRKQEELGKNRRLQERGFVSSSKVEQLEFELAKAQMTLEKNELAMKILLEYDHPKMEKQKRSVVNQTSQEYEREQKRCQSRKAQALARVEEQKAALAMREKRVARLAEQLNKCRIVAPVDGVVQYAGGEGNWRWGGEPLAVGQKVYEGQMLIILPNTTQMLVSTRIHEADRHHVREDLPCEVRVPAVPGRVFTGRISKIAKFADSANRWLNPNLKEHATEILLDQTDAPLSPGDSAEITIFIAHLSNVLAVPVQSVFARGSRSFVFVQRGLSVEPVEVKLGRSNASLVEVVEGLAQGDRVLMHVEDRYVAMLPSPDVTVAAVLPDLPLPGGPPQGREAVDAGRGRPRPSEANGERGPRAARGERLGTPEARRAPDSGATEGSAALAAKPETSGAASIHPPAKPDGGGDAGTPAAGEQGAAGQQPTSDKEPTSQPVSGDSGAAPQKAGQ